MNDHLFAELIKSLIKDNPDLSWKFKRHLSWALDDNCALICWSTHDLEQRATEVEEHQGDDVILYDRSKFKEALDALIDDHDCNWGINWETLDQYLEAYCRLEESCK